MSITTTTTTTQDFPIAFAEEKDDSTNTKFYVEWLENSSEFPGLTSSAATIDINLTGGNWELLQRKEAIGDEGHHILITIEEGEEDDNLWSKLNTTFKKEELLYSEVIEKNAAELQPKQRTIQPLWKNENKVDNTMIEEDDGDKNYEDDLGAKLIDNLKSQSRRANRYTDRRRIHDLKAVDSYVKGIYKVATNDGVQSPTVADDMIKSRGNRGRSDKANALVLCAKYAHNMKKRTFKYIYSGLKKQQALSSRTENSDYSFHSDIIVKL